jgi:hypothetical protein
MHGSGSRSVELTLRFVVRFFLLAVLTATGATRAAPVDPEPEPAHRLKWRSE